MHAKPALRLPADYRLARLSLVWFAAHVLGAIAPDAARAWLAQLRQQTRLILLAHALKRLPLPAPSDARRCYDPQAMRSPFSVRAMIGLEVNRALRGRDLRDQAGVLYEALTNPEPLIARILHRLNRRLTKRRRMRHPAFRAQAPRARATPPRAVDSS